MRAETLRVELTRALVELAWDQWAQMGVSAAPPNRREERAADPEALLLCTLEVGRSDPRLFDEVLDWLALNEASISVHRLRGLCRTPTDRALADSALSWASNVGRPTPQAETVVERDALEPLFTVSDDPLRDLDPFFARQGLARAPLAPSRKSQAPRLSDPINFAFRLRRLLGVGVRAEIVRALLTIRAPRVSGRVISASAGFAQRNVREGLTQLREAGVLSLVDVAGDSHYSTRTAHWAALLGLPNAPALPLHYDWIPTLRALTHVLRWLRRPDLDDLSDYLRASEARTLVDEIADDLRYAGVPLTARPATGTDFWAEFVQMVRVTVSDARGTYTWPGSQANHGH